MFFMCSSVCLFYFVSEGLTHLITMDLHQKEIQGFFNIPVDNLRASPFLLQYIQEEIPDYRNAVIVAKSPASAKRWVRSALLLEQEISVVILLFRSGEPRLQQLEEAACTPCHLDCQMCSVHYKW